MESEIIVSLADVRATEERRGKLKELDAQLAKSDKMVVLGTVSNLILIIGNDPELAGLVGYNEFICSHVVHRSPPVPLEGAAELPGPYPRPWDDVDVTYVQSYISRAWKCQAGPEPTRAAMAGVASLRRFHPVRDWIDGLQWDGTPRLDQWLTKAFGAPKDTYTASVASKWLIAAVRRVRQPGCKFDHMPVLEGPQGIGKSTLIRELFGTPLFTDSIPAKLESADAALCLQGVWCVEFAEIEQLIRAEVEIIKAFLSRANDRFRAPYGRNFLTYPRQCVLIGTTNDSDYLRDASGNRRFWPVRCTYADTDWITRNREQLWAEAAAREKGKEDHWFSDAEVVTEATSQQDARLQDDPWEDRIESFLSNRRMTTVSEVLNEALGVPLPQQGKKEQMRVASLLKRAGWLRKLAREGEGGCKVVRRWERGGQHG